MEPPGNLQEREKRHHIYVQNVWLKLLGSDAFEWKSNNNVVHEKIRVVASYLDLYVVDQVEISWTGLFNWMPSIFGRGDGHIIIDRKSLVTSFHIKSHLELAGKKAFRSFSYSLRECLVW